MRNKLNIKYLNIDHKIEKKSTGLFRVQFFLASKARGTGFYDLD